MTPFYVVRGDLEEVHCQVMRTKAVVGGQVVGEREGRHAWHTYKMFNYGREDKLTLKEKSGTEHRLYKFNVHF